MPNVRAQGQVTLLDITDAYSVILSNENKTFPETAAGAGTAQISSSTTVRAYRGSEEMWVYLASDVTVADTTDSSLVLTISKGAVSQSTQGLALTITTNKAGWKNSGSLSLPILVFDAQVSNNPTTSSSHYLATLTKDFSYSVAPYGETGAAPTVYELTTDTTQIIVDENNTFSPNSVTVGAISQTGDSAYTDYAVSEGNLIVTAYNAAGTGTQVGTYDSTHHTRTFAPSSTYIYYVATLTVNSKVVDKQTIGVTRDGADSYNIDITSDSGFVFKNSAISATLTAHVYKGGTEFNNANYDDSSGHYGYGTQSNPLYVNWYVPGEDSQQQPVDIPIATGVTYTISAGSVQDILTIIVKLENVKQTISA